jgi:transcriptional regulator
MYLPAHFEETRLDTLHALIRARPLATVVTLSAGGIEANHIPLELHDGGRFGTLRGHVARANPMWRDRVPSVEVLTIFQGPAGYISPSWYPTKREHGKVVPTWNYAVVHAYGALRVIEDPAWLRALLDTLVRRYEAASAEPWSIADAPPDFIEKMIESIVGLEIEVSRLVGKWKVSQNQPEQNRIGVVDGLGQRGDTEARELAQLVGEAKRNAG